MKKTVWLFILCSVLLLYGCQIMPEEQDKLPEYTSAAGLNAAAESLVEKGEFAEALRQYTEAMKTDPLDITAILGAAKCQIALHNYSTAATNLEAAMQLDSKDLRIYDLYIDLSQESADLDYARRAISLAKDNQVESFLDKIPAAPEASIPGGRYDSSLEITVKASDNTEIYVNEASGNASRSYPYSGPISIGRGTTRLELYCVKDGIPSENEVVAYTCEYPPVEVHFADPTIEMIVRTALGKESGPITDVDCENVTEIDSYNLQQMAGLDWEEYYKLRVRSFDDIAMFPNLRVFYLGPIQVEDVTDYSPLSACQNSLVQLSFTDSKLDDISFLSDFSNLEFAGFKDCSIRDLSPLKNVRNLVNLEVEGNPIEDLSVLKELHQLYSLGFTVSRQEDITMLKEFENLQTITLYNCGSYDFSVFKEMENLQYLYLYELDNYESVEIIKTLKNLKTLLMYTREYSLPMPSELYAELESCLPNCQIYAIY